MDSAKLNDWMQVVGIFAVVASLIFVGLQMRQDQLIARAELTSESFELMMALDQNLLDPEFASAYAKMLERSEDLSLEEMVQIDSLLDAVRTLYIRECYLKERGIFVECEAIVHTTVEKYFGNWYGQSWWRLNKPQSIDVLGSLPDWIDAKIESLDPNDYRRMLEEAATRN